jgi:hypothetical protein
MIPKPRLIVADLKPSRLDLTTWEQRRRMTAKELIVAMVSGHVNHPNFQPRARSLLPLENLAGRQPWLMLYDDSIRAQFKRMLLWVIR